MLCCEMSTFCISHDHLHIGYTLYGNTLDLRILLMGKRYSRRIRYIGTVSSCGIYFFYVP